MHTIGIDIRPLITTPYTGVGEYTRELLSAIFKQDHVNTYYLYYNSLSTIFEQLTSWNQENVHLVSTFYPNKIFNSALKLLNRPYIDRLIVKNYTEQHHQPISNCVDFFFSPNINFTSLSSATKHILTVHDLSFRFFPKFFSKKQQLWHTLIIPQKQYKKADLLITPSENTKQDLVNHLHINPDKIKVIYPGISYQFRKEISDDQLTYVKNHYHLPDNFILFFFISV
jgi:glycosyltransferase involved in cell wall biosynthesis